LDFDAETLELETMRHNVADWAHVVQRLRDREMPPPQSPQPSAEERAAVIAWVEQEVLQKADTLQAGRVVARRLHRSEYFNILRDLLGVDLQPPADFPRDEREWNHHASLPGIAPSQREVYRAVAELAIDQAARTGDGNRAALFACDCTDETAAANARAIIARFARRAYRAPVEPEEVDRLVTVFEEADLSGKSYADSIKAALAEVLTSPRFLCRVESARDEADTSPRQTDQVVLASRLSFFLWRTGPDDELLGLAERGVLADRLESQVHRLLQDPQARAFARDFAASWLALDKLNEVTNLDPELRRAMRQETELLVETIVREDRTVVDFLDADYTFVNERLASHYGIPGISGEVMRRISVRGMPRGGLLTQGSILSLTAADGADTHPVKRGKWVQENLLGAAPIRPPAGILQALQDTRGALGPGTRAEQMALHRTNPSCAGCHQKIDGIGLALENFGPRGAWRPLDAVGELPNGQTLRGVGDLKAHLLRNRDRFVRSLAERMLRFALGRKLDDRDRSDLVHVAANTAPHEHRFSRVVLEVVNSPAFLDTGSPEARVQP
jgi:hypothetical protein